jgi:O-6-methylguanine DNA methyltransferase
MDYDRWTKIATSKTGWHYTILNDFPCGPALVCMYDHYFCYFVLMPENSFKKTIPNHMIRHDNHVKNYLNKKQFDVLMVNDEVRVKVYQSLCDIPLGETRTYKQIAESVGHPKMIRPIASMIGANPFPYFIPCHRVILSTGKIGGFLWGSDLKQSILNHESNLIKSK